MRKLTVLTLCHLMIGKSIGHSRSRVKPCAGRVRERCRSHLCHLQRARRESPVARVCHPGPGRRSWGRLARPSSTSSARSDRRLIRVARRHTELATVRADVVGATASAPPASGRRAAAASLALWFMWRTSSSAASTATEQPPRLLPAGALASIPKKCRKRSCRAPVFGDQLL